MRRDDEKIECANRQPQLFHGFEAEVCCVLFPAAAAAVLQLTGDITVGQVLTMLPYANAVSIFTVAGSALIAAVKNGLSAYPSGGRFLQVGVDDGTVA